MAVQNKSTFLIWCSLWIIITWSLKTFSKRRKRKKSHASPRCLSLKDLLDLASVVSWVCIFWCRFCPWNTFLWGHPQCCDWKPCQICYHLLNRKCFDPCSVNSGDILRTSFLIGFKRQIKNMADLDRRVASIVFIVALVGTLVSAIVFSSKLLVIIFLAIQIPAYIWYCASYIPFARTCIKSCLKKCFSKSKDTLDGWSWCSKNQ